MAYENLNRDQTDVFGKHVRIIASERSNCQAIVPEELHGKFRTDLQAKLSGDLLGFKKPSARQLLMEKTGATPYKREGMAMIELDPLKMLVSLNTQTKSEIKVANSMLEEVLINIGYTENNWGQNRPRVKNIGSRILQCGKDNQTGEDYSDESPVKFYYLQTLLENVLKEARVNGIKLIIARTDTGLTQEQRILLGKALKLMPREVQYILLTRSNQEYGNNANGIVPYLDYTPADIAGDLDLNGKDE